MFQKISIKSRATVVDRIKVAEAVIISEKSLQTRECMLYRHGNTRAQGVQEIKVIRKLPEGNP